MTSDMCIMNSHERIVCRAHQIRFKLNVVSTDFHETFVKYGFMKACHLHTFLSISRNWTHVTENAEIVPFVTSFPCNLLDYARGVNNIYIQSYPFNILGTLFNAFHLIQIVVF